MNVPCVLPAKKVPRPQLKLTCVSASRKTRPFAPTVRADLKVFGPSEESTHIAVFVEYKLKAKHIVNISVFVNSKHFQFSKLRSKIKQTFSTCMGRAAKRWCKISNPRCLAHFCTAPLEYAVCLMSLLRAGTTGGSDHEGEKRDWLAYYCAQRKYLIAQGTISVLARRTCQQ